MKYNAVYKFVALAASVAIAGCVAPTSLTKVETGKTALTSAQAADHTGSLQLNVHWPQKGGFQTQDIPDRAEKLVVTLTASDSTVIGTREAYRASYGRIDTYASNFAWTLPEQRNVTVKAVLYDANGGQIGEAAKVIDVVAGLNAYVALDILIADAPKVATLSRNAFRIGDKVIITGEGFGKTKGYFATAYLESEGLFSYKDSPFPYQYNYQVNLPGSSVVVKSDNEIEVTIPEQTEYYGRLTDRLWNYFHGDDTQKLYLGVVVDGVNSNRIEVSMPKVASVSTTVTLQQGTDAPDHVATTPTVLDLASESFNVPIASGTQWNFRVTEDWGYMYSQPNINQYTIRLTDNDGQIEFQSNYWNQPSYDDLLPTYDYGYDPMFGFLLRLKAVGPIQTVGEEEMLCPDGYQRLAKHLFYNPPQNYIGSNGYMVSGTARDLWVVPEIGVVRMVETRLEQNQYEQSPRRVTRTYDLTGFVKPLAQ